MLEDKIIYTVGHSNRSIEEFLTLLKKYDIRVLVDVRRFPTSRKFPHFTRENLSVNLNKHGVKYLWLKNLGGYRGHIPGAEKYRCFRAQGYRNYVAWMHTDEWKSDFRKLVELALTNICTIMCAERFPWRCHRKLISDALLAEGFKVIHILDKDKTYIHKLTKCARIINGKLQYI